MADRERLELVTLETTNTEAEARVIAAILQADGIPVYVQGDSLQDEFAISQRAMNLSAVEVRVPRACLEDARAALEAHRSACDETEESPDDRG